MIDNTYFLGLDHALDHDNTKAGKDISVKVLTEGDVSGSRLHHSSGAQVQQWKFHDGKLLNFLVKLGNQLGPVLQANLENLALIDLGNLEQVLMSDQKHLSVLRVLDKLYGLKSRYKW
jgi:hypothetical protein